MKIFNETLAARGRRIEPVLRILFFLRILWLPVALFARLRPNRPDFFVADGFLIGDCVLLRPLLRAMVRTGGSVVYLGGPHAETLLSDLPVKKIVYQWPWAAYDYHPLSFLKLGLVFLRILLLQPRIVVEPRGDLRTISLLHLAWPSKLIGYSFTGGRFMLDLEPPVPDIAHLEEHNRRIADVLGLEYSRNDVEMSLTRQPEAAEIADPAGALPTRSRAVDRGRSPSSRQRPILLSFSGSQPLKTLPITSAEIVLKELTTRNREIVYLAAPRDHFLADPAGGGLLREHNVQIWKGGFREYVEQIRQCAGYVGMDSGGGHIASVFGIPSVIFFGTMRADYCGPIGKNMIAVETIQRLQCRPCGGISCVNDHFQFCLTSIPPDRIQNAIAALPE